MTALERLAALRVMMGEPAEIDSLGTLHIFSAILCKRIIIGEV
jgi:hypothetical protein